MYSTELEKLLQKLNIAIGDRIHLKTEKFDLEGLLMPRAHESDTLVIKMDSGYNVGISSKHAEITLLSKFQRPAQVPEKETHKGEVAILGCGGTIASKVEYKTGAVFPAISPSELKKAFPKLEEISTIHAKSLFSIFSEDMNSYHWEQIAKAVIEEIKEGVKGVVLMHGTDTMHYTSAALSFILQSLPVPVILVGSQRSSDRPSSDNEINLLNSVYAAKEDFAGVGVCMHANINDDFCFLHAGTRARKMHTSRRDAFKSVNTLPLAKIDYKNKIFQSLTNYPKRNPQSRIKMDTRINNNVALVYVHPNINPKFISSLNSYDGVVLIGTGLGHLPINSAEEKHGISIFKEVKSLIDSNIPVAITSQTIFGRINLNVYTTGRLINEIGILGHGLDITPETAFIKLSWILGHTKDMKKIKEEYYTNYAGEFSDRSVFI